jgi:hypothetical protein
MMKQHFEIYVLSFLLLFLSAGVIYGGGSLILAPDGTLLQMDPRWLELIPFPDYLIPGVILFTLLGIFPLISLFCLFYKKTIPLFNRFNIYREKQWGWTFTLYTGIISIIWIVVQQIMAEYFVLQSIIAGNGILIVILCLLPRVQKYYQLH